MDIAMDGVCLHAILYWELILRRIKSYGDWLVLINCM